MDTNKKTRFFTSRRNLVGMLLAIGVIVAHLILGLGSLWFIAAAAAYGAGVALTPPAQQQRPQALPPAGPAELHQKFMSIERSLYGRALPDPIAIQLRRIREELTRLLPRWEDLADVPERREALRGIIQVHLPTITEGYLRVPNPNDPRAVAQVDDALALLVNYLEETNQAIVDNTLMDLEDATRATQLQFGPTSLPGVALIVPPDDEPGPPQR
ncbi:hypothetical protein [Corynebacterium uterequi]|uniref:Uncharacterized protein n=1 Tax=Corynebacterium uterequi TaxID=1072256 RepID=A0A0G3HCB1_9CORY|nr:hypothetical protein [Corynebacterium uterequi]AKK11021.1 hypothetical protein CUTER_05100 [Corynebacterium uterequi]